MVEEYEVTLPTRDVQRRELFGLMLGLDKRSRNKLTVEEMEDLCIKRGFLKVVKK